MFLSSIIPFFYNANAQVLTQWDTAIEINPKRDEREELKLEVKSQKKLVNYWKGKYQHDWL